MLRTEYIRVNSTEYGVANALNFPNPAKRNLAYPSNSAKLSDPANTIAGLALVAQLDRASVFGTEGWGFEPLRVQ